MKLQIKLTSIIDLIPNFKYRNSKKLFSFSLKFLFIEILFSKEK